MTLMVDASKRKCVASAAELGRKIDIEPHPGGVDVVAASWQMAAIELYMIHQGSETVPARTRISEEKVIRELLRVSLRNAS